MRCSKESRLKYRYRINDRFAMSEHYAQLSTFFLSYEQLPNLSESDRLQRCTGLVDNDDVDIYEGDFIRCIDVPSNRRIFRRSIKSDGDVYKVLWDQHSVSFYLRPFYGVPVPIASKINLPTFVVGNTHEGINK